jgi:anti-sigma regulatory factor (Ser/Thr protein kinase)
VLDFSKIEANKLELMPSNFNFPLFLNSIIDLFKMSAESKGLKLIFEPLTALPQVVKADEKRLRQILLNLLSNAIKFTTQGEITLQIRYQNEFALFKVIDTGCGILNDQLHLIFEPFLQVGTQNQKLEGTGLGLPISKNLVELMRGELQVQSIPNKGSEFFFEIPLLSVNQKLVMLSENQEFLVVQKESSQEVITTSSNLVVPNTEQIQQLLMLVKKGKVKQIVNFMDNLLKENAQLNTFAIQVKILANNLQLAKLKTLLMLHNK